MIRPARTAAFPYIAARHLLAARAGISGNWNLRSSALFRSATETRYWNTHGIGRQPIRCTQNGSAGRFAACRRWHLGRTVRSRGCDPCSSKHAVWSKAERPAYLCCSFDPTRSCCAARELHPGPASDESRSRSCIAIRVRALRWEARVIRSKKPGRGGRNHVDKGHDGNPVSGSSLRASEFC